MRKKLFNLTRKEREELLRRYKQKRDKGVAQRTQSILNLIEGLWELMKKEVLRNKYYRTFEEFVGAVK